MIHQLRWPESSGLSVPILIPLAYICCWVLWHDEEKQKGGSCCEAWYPSAPSSRGKLMGIPSVKQRKWADTIVFNNEGVDSAWRTIYRDLRREYPSASTTQRLKYFFLVSMWLHCVRDQYHQELSLGSGFVALESLHLASSVVNLCERVRMRDFFEPPLWIRLNLLMRGQHRPPNTLSCPMRSLQVGLLQSQANNCTSQIRDFDANRPHHGLSCESQCNGEDHKIQIYMK